MNNEIKDRLSDSDISTTKKDSTFKNFTSKVTSVSVAVALSLGTAALTTSCKNDDCDTDIGTFQDSDPSDLTTNPADTCDAD